MKKSNASTFSFNLNAYAAAAICFLNTRETDSQVIYTDIDPDIVYDEALEGGGLDIDANGTIDFTFLNSSFTFYSASFSSVFTRQDILVGPTTSLNAIAGNSQYVTSSYGEGFTLYYPFALNEGDIINGSLPWFTAGQQIMGIRTFVGYAGPNTWQCAYCNWYGFFAYETINGFLPIRFTDGEQNYYGWIRCDVLDEGRTLIIKDYAYESQPDHAILAGDTTHFLPIFENTNNIDANVYSFDNSIYVKLDELIKDLEIHVYDISGKIVYSDRITNQLSQMELSEPKGAYIVKLISGEKKYSIKIFIN